jgi:hypothetical protein
MSFSPLPRKGVVDLDQRRITSGETNRATRLDAYLNRMHHGSKVRCQMCNPSQGFYSGYDAPESELPEQEGWSMQPQEPVK